MKYKDFIDFKIERMTERLNIGLLDAWKKLYWDDIDSIRSLVSTALGTSSGLEYTQHSMVEEAIKAMKAAGLEAELLPEKMLVYVERDGIVRFYGVLLFTIGWKRVIARDFDVTFQ